MKKAILGLLLSSIFIIGAKGCNEPVCDPEDTRCSDLNAQVCNSHGEWETVMNCQEVTPEGEDSFVCCAFEGNHTCLPAILCEGGE